ncbi:hypothetical protein C8R43DRAFT_1119019 [Mycena crocata]|nr:hypothetical protein C8R43DRAFT_1119019 [Mycena crocata]
MSVPPTIFFLFQLREFNSIHDTLFQCLHGTTVLLNDRTACHTLRLRLHKTTLSIHHSSGCVVGNVLVLQACCVAFGSTPAFTNNTCKCPFNEAFAGAADIRDFAECVVVKRDSRFLVKAPQRDSGRVLWRQFY